MTQSAPTQRRGRRDRRDIRQLLIEAAMVEFGTHGFDGASTRAIAARAEAHQPQINYHFASKEELWRAAVDQLLDELDVALAPSLTIADLGDRFAAIVRALVHFAARRPQLHQIVVQEATSPTERMTWIAEHHVRPRYEATKREWRRLKELGIAAPIDDDVFHYVLMGATSLPYVNAAEASILMGGDPADPERVERHADSLVATLLPGRRTEGSV